MLHAVGILALILFCTSESFEMLVTMIQFDHSFPASVAGDNARRLLPKGMKDEGETEQQVMRSAAEGEGGGA